MFRGLLTRSLAFALVLVGAVLSLASPAAAHTGFDSSTPADGDVVDGAVAEIVIRFTGPATPAGDGFTVLDADGAVRTPSAVTVDDDQVFRLQFDPPLAGGPIGVRWMVRAPDAHPIDGSFSFTVTAPAPPTSVAAVGSDDASAATPGDDTTEVGVSEGGVSLDEFLATDAATPGEGRQLVGRIVSYPAVIGAVGGLAFLGFTLRGTRREIAAMLVVIGALGAVAAVGAGMEYSGWLAQATGTVFGEATSTPGLGMVLRLAGGLLLAGAAVAAANSSGRRPRVRPARPLSAAVLLESDAPDTRGARLRGWDPRSAPVALAGASMLVASFWFGGHTVSEGPRVLHAAVNSVHVVSASVWVGGVSAMVGVLFARRRRGAPIGAAALVVRFSSIAAVALVAVVVAGAVMAVFVLDAPADLTSTEWGKILLLKTAGVGIAALVGAYNHFRLRPLLEATPDDDRLEAEFRSTLLTEAILLMFVVVTTAWLVAAAT